MALLNIGDQAPDFQGKNQFDQQISLGEYKGRKVILYFYPKDSTPGCTAEACNLRDNNHVLLKKGFIIIGVSADSEASHQKFAEKYSLPFSLLADSDKKIINDYGVWGPKKFLGKTYNGIIRTTYVISEEGKIEKVFTKVNTKDHAAQILEQY
jgi:peroxiredoxin Q/BCP